MKRCIATLIAAFAGFALFAFCGYWMIVLTSSNGHDRAVEASMMSFLFFGPGGAPIGGIVGFMASNRTQALSANEPFLHTQTTPSIGSTHVQVSRK